MGLVQQPGERSIEQFLQKVRDERVKSHPIQQLEDAIAEAKKTGKRVKLVFKKEDMDKEEFFQELLNDPRTKNLSKDRVFLDVSPYEELSVDELADLCLAAGTNCKLAMEKVASLQFRGKPFPGDMSIIILKQDIQALKDAAIANGHTGKVTSVPTEPKNATPTPKAKKSS